MATQAKAQNQPINTRRRRNEMREKAMRQRRNQNYIWLGIGILLTALVVFIVYLNFRETAPVAGEEEFFTQGNTHIDQNSRSPISYNSTPPTSGPHYGNIVAWESYDEPIRYEQLVHNMEDGGVILYYQCEEACPELVAELEEVVQPYMNAGRHVILVPNDPTWSPDGGQPLHRDMESRIAVAAWQKLIKMDEVDVPTIRAFIDRYEGRDHHVRY